MKFWLKKVVHLGSTNMDFYFSNFQFIIYALTYNNSSSIKKEKFRYEIFMVLCLVCFMSGIQCWKRYNIKEIGGRFSKIRIPQTEIRHQ